MADETLAIQKKEGVVMTNAVTKMTLKELEQNKKWEEAVIVFAPESFDGQYTLEERSYKVWSNAKWFDPTMIGNSLIANCLNGKDMGVRLDHYIQRLPNEGNTKSNHNLGDE